jgi:hypothetical protein
VKRGTIDHPKMRALVAALPIGGCRYQAVGILESLWHFTALYAYRGDVGRHTDTAIAEWIGWKGSPDSLIEPLVKTGWLNRADGPERLVVHDWMDHCDDSVKKRFSREAQNALKCPPHIYTCPDMSRHGGTRARGEGQEAIGEGQKALDGEEETGKTEKAKRTPFTRPTLEEVTAYCAERGKGVVPESWMAHYEANGWKVGSNAMKDWKAAVRTWEHNGNHRPQVSREGVCYLTKETQDE